jgi:HEAT repeat protein
MDKLLEREIAPRAGPLAAAPALAVQFFLIPLAVVAVLVAVYTGFQMLLADERTAQDYLVEIRSGGRERRWPAAYELSRLMGDPRTEAADPGLGPALVAAFKDSANDDPRVRQYLALAIGRLKSPPPGAAEALLGATGDPNAETVISVIWALGALGDPSVVPQLETLYASSDSGVRKVVVYALGALPGEAQRDTLYAALNDSAADVQWNSAIGLARLRDGHAAPVLRRMLNREYVAGAVTRATGPTADIDPVDEIMISGLRAVAVLKETGLREPVEALSRTDRSLSVRQAAMEALKQMGS